MTSPNFQKTLAGEVILPGKTLFSGRECRVILRPAPENHGIQFVRRDLPGEPRVSGAPETIADSIGPFRCTTLSQNNARVYPTEHFMAAFHGLGISNVLVVMDQEELPFFDGSARDILEALQKAGIRSQDAPVPEITLDKEMQVKNGREEIQLFPSGRLRVEYHLEHAPPIGAQNYSFDYSEEAFIKEIAPARTFCTEAEAQQFLTRGGKGGSLGNCLVFGTKGLLEGVLRFPEEPARHKILDLIGDLSLLGKNIKAHIIAKRSGHGLNAALVRELQRRFIK